MATALYIIAVFFCADEIKLFLTMTLLYKNNMNVSKIYTCAKEFKCAFLAICGPHFTILDTAPWIGHSALILTLPNMKRAGVAQPRTDNTFRNVLKS